MVQRSGHRVTNLDEDREQSLSAFDRARENFEEAVRRAPDAALRFLPPGEDYALGGLVVHVTDVLKNYAGVLQEVHAADWQQLTAPEHQTSPRDAALIRDGFDGGMRGRVMEEMRTAHSALLEAVLLEPAEWYRRQAAVTYSGSSEPYPTSPADVVGWVRDHYDEHTLQITELVSQWAVATR